MSFDVPADPDRASHAMTIRVPDGMAAYETLRLVTMSDGVFYIAKVADNELPVPFRLARCTDGVLVFEKDLVKAEPRPGQRAFGVSSTRIAEERERRFGRPKRGERPTLSRIRQYLANLELDPGASWPEIQRAYEKLRERYHPDKHAAHPERHETAVELTESLNKAYEALRRYFER